MTAPFPCRLHRTDVSRRDFLWELGGGLGGVALTALLAEEARAAARATNPLAAKPPMFPGKARAVINIFCPGGLSHLDTFDYKPELVRRDGTPFDSSGTVQFFASKPGNCQPSYWPFRQHGESGRWVSDLLPKLAGHVDEMAFIHSMQSKTALHGPAMFMANSGFILPGFPSMGAWVTYGLGSESEDLPAFVVLPDHRGLPPGGPVNWGAGFLPAIHQGTVIETADGRPPVADLFAADAHADLVAGEPAGREFLALVNARHLEARSESSELAARIAAYELAARLQLSAPEVTNLAGESDVVEQLYQLDHPDIGPFSRQCLLARRLVERGVRFVQIYHTNWDHHGGPTENLDLQLPQVCGEIDRAAAALVLDLKRRGLLDETLVIWSGEFGRTPMGEVRENIGRDHHVDAFTLWMAGGGVKAGHIHGQTDELGFGVVEGQTHVHDLHATILHLLGFDHERLTFRFQGRDFRLTDVHGRVVEEILT